MPTGVTTAALAAAGLFLAMDVEVASICLTTGALINEVLVALARAGSNA